MSGIFGIDLPKLNYTSGETLQGAVIFEPKAVKKLYGIHLHFSGFEFCENSILNDEPYSRKWILDGSTTLFGNKIRTVKDTSVTENEAFELVPGSYRWPFAIPLPDAIPPSCEHRFGKVKIQYTLVAFVDVPWGKGIKCSQIIKIGFPFVVDPSKHSRIFRADKSFLIRHTTNGKSRLNVEAFVDKPITYHGDRILLNVKIDNNSGKNVQALKVKLKQVWNYGGNSEKIVTFKIKQRERGFPLKSGIWEGQIPILISNTENRPSIRNAVYIRVRYYISLQVMVHLGGNLKLRVPLLMASFPPLQKLNSTYYSIQEINDNKEEVEEGEEGESAEEEENSPPNFDWDNSINSIQSGSLSPALAPQSSNYYYPQPTSSSSFYHQDSTTSSYQQSVTSPSSNSSSASSPNVLESEYDQLLTRVEDKVKELDSLIHWTTSGYLLDIENVPELSIEITHSNLQQCIHYLYECTRKLEFLLSHPNNESDGFSCVAAIASKLLELGEVSKHFAVKTEDCVLQQAVLHYTKTATCCGSQVLSDSKSLILYDAQNTTQFLQAKKSIEQFEASCQELLQFTIQSSPHYASKISDIENSKKEMEQIFKNLVNPFGDFGNSEVTFDQLKNTAFDFNHSIQEFEETLQNPTQSISPKVIAMNARHFLQNVRGTVDKIPTISSQLLEAAKSVSCSLERLLEIASQTVAQGIYADNLLRDCTKEVQTIVMGIVNSTEKEIQTKMIEQQELQLQHTQEQRMNQMQEQQIQQDVSHETTALQEILTAVQTIENVNSVFAQTHFPVPQDVISSENVSMDAFNQLQFDDMSSSLIQATKQLLLSALVCQQERISSAQNPTSLYFHNSTWTEGLVSAAKQVAALMEELVKATQGTLTEEKIAAIGKQINIAMTQLLTAENVKSNVNSDSHSQLQMAAKLVIQKTNELINSMKQKNLNFEEKLNVSNQPVTMTEKRVRELEANVKVVQLEKELEYARKQLQQIYKDDYHKS